MTDVGVILQSNAEVDQKSPIDPSLLYSDLRHRRGDARASAFLQGLAVSPRVKVNIPPFNLEGLINIFPPGGKDTKTSNAPLHPDPLSIPSPPGLGDLSEVLLPAASQVRSQQQQQRFQATGATSANRWAILVARGPVLF